MKPRISTFIRRRANLARAASCAPTPWETRPTCSPRRPKAGRQVQLMRDLNAVSPDAAAALIDTIDQPWQHDPWVHGAYAVYRPGQSFAFGRCSNSPTARCSSRASTSRDWQGFMEGAVSTGEIAAQHSVALMSPETRMTNELHRQRTGNGPQDHAPRLYERSGHDHRSAGHLAGAHLFGQTPMLRAAESPRL